ncbi:hypothetical protein NHQ30_010154 [Ciborinia camelliae]|nr:hypothetical protein NHQ30_010154 [Ciborinia camelliae]
MPPALNPKSPRPSSPSDDEREVSERQTKRPRKDNVPASLNLNLGSNNLEVARETNTTSLPLQSTSSQGFQVDPSEYHRLKLEVEALRRAYHAGRTARDVFNMAHNATTGFDRMSTREWLASWINGTSLILGEESSSYKNVDPCQNCKERGLVCFGLAENDKYYDIICEEGYDCCGWCMRYTRQSGDNKAASKTTQLRSVSPDFQPGVAPRQLQVMVGNTAWASAKIILPTKLQYFVTGIEYGMTDIEKKVKLILGDQAWIEPGDKFNHTTSQWERGVWIGTSPEYPLMEFGQAPRGEQARRGPPLPDPDRWTRQTPIGHSINDRYQIEKSQQHPLDRRMYPANTVGLPPREIQYSGHGGHAAPPEVQYSGHGGYAQPRPYVYVRAPDRTPTPSAEAPPIPSIDNSRHTNSYQYQ